MAARTGRPPKPTALKVLHGDKPSRINRSEPQMPAGSLVPPDWLTNPRGLEMWHRVAPVLERAGVLRAGDVEAFGLCCDAYGQYVEASIVVAREGVMVESRDRGLVKHPGMQICRDAAATFARYAAQFGLTPAARSQLTVERAERDDELEALLS